MKTRILVLTVLNVLATFAVASAGGQAQWDERAVQGGVEFRLLNDKGAAIVLRCTDQGVHAEFMFAEPIEEARGALVRGQFAKVGPGRVLPSGRILPSSEHRFPVVAQVSDRTVQVVSGRGVASTLVLLANATNIRVRTAGRLASFEVAGSDSMLARCPRAEDWLRAGYGAAPFDWYIRPGQTSQGHTFESGAASGPQ